MSQFLRQEQDTFKEKGWNILENATFVLKILFSIISFVYLFSKLQDEIKEFKNYNKKD
ncbi:MAG: hypothetical protein U9Q83_06705 [Bacteroidota bacterium]|nr:hypothetical protein [Bacteroidota bacterium]